MKLIMEQWRTNVLGEGITDVVFHKTRLDQAAQIMQNNKFMTSVAFGTQADKDQNKGKLYYLSTMRSPTGDYGPGLPAVTFKLDGRKLGYRSKAAAVDYWGPDFPKDEMEDRVFTDEPYLEPATEYITEIHVGLPIEDKHRKMRPARIEEAEAIAAAAEGAGIPAYFYVDEKTYGIINKTKRLTLDQWKQAFKKSGAELDEPWGYESSGPYIADALKGTVEIMKALESGDTESIEKGHNSTWYKIKYDYGGEWGRRIENAVHNSKSEPAAREYISAIGKQLKKHGNLDGFVEWLQGEIKKTEGEQKLKQVAERHGFINEVAIGQCYPHAVKMAQDATDEEFADLSRFKVVHGRITDKWSGESAKHAWVEKGNTIFDWQTQSTKPKGIDRATYYDNFQPEIHNEYTAEETMVNCLKQGQPGPWTDKL